MSVGRQLHLVSYYFAPLGRADGVNRTYLAKHLAEQGWDLNVVSCGNPHGFLRNFQEDPSLLEVLPASVTLRRVKCPYWGPLGDLAVMAKLTRDPFLNWVWAVKRRWQTLFPSPGILYAIVPPIANAFVALHVRRMTGWPLTVDFRDDVRCLPHDLMTDTDLVVASTDRSLGNMLALYRIPPDRGVTVYNGFGHGTPPTEGPPEDARLRIVFAGLLNSDQDPCMIARACNGLSERSPELRGRVQLDFFGPENYYTQFFLRRHLNANVRFRGYVPLAHMLREIAHADVGCSTLTTGGNAYRIPSKVFQYLAMERPILATGPEGALKDFVLQHNIGRFSRADDMEGQMADILFFLEHPEERQRMVENIRRIKPEFSMANQVAKLSGRLEALLGDANAGGSLHHEHDG